ncbi:CRISPR-associated protein Cas5 [Terrisporobacter sp.]
MSKEKVLLLDIYQPFAHYREALMMQDDYIPTLNLPTATTIAGMVSYLIDRKLKSKFNIAVVGTYKNKNSEFIRGEDASLIKSYGSTIEKEIKRIKKENSREQINYGDIYNYNKITKKNRIMNFEVLQDVNLKIFLKTEDDELVKRAFEKPNKYLSLGRKEDFIYPSHKGDLFIKEVEIEKIHINSKIESIKNKYKIKNTYVPIDLKSENNNNNLLNSGVLYSLPKIYKDLTAEKSDRVILYGNYIYIDDQGAYLDNIDINVYKENDNEESIIFTWL